ncbi:MAG: hypothetical protein KA144_08150 [Xanthomonadaceae bacterium]|nr:hypothetical protein [Xanthomonadaceae bacterium]
MKIETRSIYVAFDGKEFQTEDDCRSHERAQSGGRLVGLTEAQIAAALSGEDRELGDAFETIGRRVAQGRIERGELKRERRKSAQPAPAPTETSAPQPAHPHEGAAQ